MRQHTASTPGEVCERHVLDVDRAENAHLFGGAEMPMVLRPMVTSTVSSVTSNTARLISMVVRWATMGRVIAT